MPAKPVLPPNRPGFPARLRPISEPPASRAGFLFCAALLACLLLPPVSQAAGEEATIAAAVNAYRYGAPDGMAHYPPTPDGLYIWYARTVQAEKGMLTYHFFAMMEDGPRTDTITLTTNAGKAEVRELGGAGSRRISSFSLTAKPLSALVISSVRVDGKPAPLKWINPKTTPGAPFPHDLRPVVLPAKAATTPPDPRLSGKRLRLTLAPTLPASQGIGIFLFSLEGERGFPPLDAIWIEVVAGHGEGYGWLETLLLHDKGLTPAGTWQASLAYEGFLTPGGNSSQLIAPAYFLIHSAAGTSKGEEFDLLPSLDVVPFQRLPVLTARPGKR